MTAGPAQLTTQKGWSQSVPGVTGVRPLGPETETARIGTFLRQPGSGERVLLLTGEAGSGKTTLLGEGRSTAAASGHHVLSATPVETETALAYWPRTRCTARSPPCSG